MVCNTLPCLSPVNVLSSDTSYITSFISEPLALIEVLLIASVIWVRVLFPISCIFTVIISPDGKIIGIEISIWSK